jgi:hypothetical protein
VGLGHAQLAQGLGFATTVGERTLEVGDELVRVAQQRFAVAAQGGDGADGERDLGIVAHPLGAGRFPFAIGR